jgi:putative flippase GtrA
MAKLQLKAAPTFQAEVGIPAAGGVVTNVSMTFKHRTKSELDEFIKGRVGKSDVESFMEMVTGWELEDEFTEASVKTLLENYIGAAQETFFKYVDELVQAKRKN